MVVPVDVHLRNIVPVHLDCRVRKCGLLFNEHESEFQYTTIELHRNYAANMHVDGNNHGPSRSIALGNYTGDEVWLVDETNGTM